MINAQRTTISQVLASQLMTNSATITANLDTIQADYAEVIFNFSAELNTNADGPTISFLESDDTVVTNFATFDADFERATEDLTSAKPGVYKINLLGRKRFLRVSISTAAGDTNDDVTVGVIGILSRKEQEPANAAAMIQSGGFAVIG